VKIIIKNLQKKIPVYPTRIKKAILKVLSKEGKRKSIEITVCFVSDAGIRELNKKYLHRDGPTDVLVFDLGASADIIVSAQTAIRNAEIFKTTLQGELNLYVTHGLLHLLGYDDCTPKQRKLMRKKELEYVNT
jgi:probable rRNA maturation factor